MNAATGEVVAVSENFARAVARRPARRPRRPTGSSTRRSAARSSPRATRATSTTSRPDPSPAGPAAGGRWRDVLLSGRLLRRPRGLELDLNGVVKGLTVDDALGLLSGAGFVAAGGDLAVRGGAVVALPGGGAVDVRPGGLATSGTATRRWRRGGEQQHHLIDPATACPRGARGRRSPSAAATA